LQDLTPILDPEAEGFFDLSQDVGWEVAEFAFEMRFDEGTDPLDVDDGRVVEKREVSYGDFVAASTMLCGERDVGDECAWRVSIIPRHDEDGRRFAANPRSASQISPGLAFIEGIEDFLGNRPRGQEIERISVGHGNHVTHELLHLRRDLGVPCGEFFVELLGQLRHADTVTPSHERRKRCRGSPPPRRNILISSLNSA